MKLTNAEVEAVLAVLDERIAGGVDDLRDALGVNIEQAELTMQRLENASLKLAKANRNGKGLEANSRGGR